MNSLVLFQRRHTTTSAAIIFAVAIILVYSPVIFLDQSYNRALPLPQKFLENDNNKSTIFGTTVDQYGDFQAIWPILKTGTELFSQGQIPLWNPYVGVGQPLAADSTFHIFSPLTLGFFLPTQFWDVPLLIPLWIAGIFTYLFLRNLGLNFTASVSGGVLYMLSGSFSWYLTNPNAVVMTFSPFILYSLEKILQNRHPKYIVLASISFSFGILGGHIESVILQFILVCSYLFYRIGYSLISNFKTKLNGHISTANDFVIKYDVRRMSLWSLYAILGGFGLSAFFIIPVYEVIENSHLEHDASFGLAHYDPVNLPTAFMPYILGQLNAYWIHASPGLIGVWGYVGVSSLFFSILGVWYSLKKNHVHKYTPLFFLALSIFFIMKTIGVPIVNWIGYLPILNLVVFTSYLGVIIPFGFAVSAAFGINLLVTSCPTKKNLALTCAISILTLLLLLIPLISYLFSPDAKIASYVTISDTKNYVGFQVIQAIVFAILIFFLSVKISKNKVAIVGLIPLILLEMSLYVPMGLHPVWMAYKSLFTLAGMVAIVYFISRSNIFTGNPTLNLNNKKIFLMISILIVISIGYVLISESSPFGLMKKHDSFIQTPVTKFFKENLGNSRMFSFDYTMGPNYPAAYEINTIGQLSPFNIVSFYDFIHNFLDKQAIGGRLGDPAWTYFHGPMDSINTFFDNKKYFDFLGVKYILTQGYDFNTIAPGIPGISGEFTKIESRYNDTGQSFSSPTNSITAIGISLGTLSLHNQGNIILTLDSIPHDDRYHRESFLNSTTNQQFNEFKIEPPLTDILDKKFYLTLRYPEAENGKLAVVFTYKENQTGFDMIKNKLQGKFYKNGLFVDKEQMAFSIVSNSNENQTIFKFHDIYVYENTNAFPRAFLASNFTVVNTNKAQNFLFENPKFDLRHSFILEEQLPDELNKLLKLSTTINETSEAKITSYSANKVMIETKSKTSSFLILTDGYYPGWKVFVDGKESKIYRVDGLVRGVFVHAGNHMVEFSYIPNSFFIGVIISIMTSVILIMVLILSRKNLRMLYHDFVPK